MLYDPKWEQKIETKPSLAGFIAWLERQDPTERYQYMSCHCAIGKYAESFGESYFGLMGDYLNDFCAWNMNITIHEPRTYGAALERAREYAAHKTAE